MTEPRSIADRMHELGDLRKRKDDRSLHETITLTLHEARFKARQLLNERASSYVKIVENWRQLPDGQIQFYDPPAAYCRLADPAKCPSRQRGRFIKRRRSIASKPRAPL
jgi:hypothetical protein